MSKTFFKNYKESYFFFSTDKHLSVITMYKNIKKINLNLQKKKHNNDNPSNKNYIN